MLRCCNVEVLQCGGVARYMIRNHCNFLNSNGLKLKMWRQLAMKLMAINSENSSSLKTSLLVDNLTVPVLTIYQLVLKILMHFIHIIIIMLITALNSTFSGKKMITYSIFKMNPCHYKTLHYVKS